MEYIFDMKIVTMCVLSLVVLLLIRSCARDDRGVYVLKIGDSYENKKDILKDEFRFLFRIRYRNDIYEGYEHNSISKKLIFKDGDLVYIGDGIRRDMVCYLFKDMSNGWIHKSCRQQYLYSMSHVKSLIELDGKSNEQFIGGMAPVDACNSNFDIGLTLAVLTVRCLGWISSFVHSRHPLSDCIGINYERLSIGLNRKSAEEFLGSPVYTEDEVVYYGNYKFSCDEKQLIGVSYSNNSIYAVFSSEMLDPRITRKYWGMECVGVEQRP